MKSAEDTLELGIADCLDRRRQSLTETLRVATSLKESVLLSQACRMAIPMIYAIWEGFAKESLQLYLEYIEAIALPQSQASTALLAYAWTGSFKKLSSQLTHAKKVELVDRFYAGLTDHLVFDKKLREIDTKSNLMFEVLEDIAKSLCLEITPLKDHSKKLDALVNRRNNIAHGGRDQTLNVVTVEEYRDLVLALMAALESTLLSAIETRAYERKPVEPPALATS